MAMSTETIRRITIEARTTGVDEATAKLGKLADAQGGVAVASERTSKASLSAETGLDRLQRRYDAAYRAQHEMAKVEKTLADARNQGLIGLSRSNELLGLAEQRLKGAAVANENHAKAVGAGATQMMAATHAARSFADSIMAGQSPMTAAAQQFGHLQYALSGDSGIVASFGRGAGAVLGFAGGIAAGAAIAVTSYERWDAAQRKVALGLVGVGRGSGMTVSGVTDLAQSSAAGAGLAIPDARDIAATMASTGKAGPGDMVAGMKAARDLAVTFKTDLTGAGEILAKVFNDPVASFDELNKRLGFGTAATREYVHALQDQSRYQEAGQAVVAAMVPTLGKANDLMSFSAKVAEEAGQKWKQFWFYVDRGAAVAAGTSLGPADDRKQLASLDQQLAGMKAALAAEEDARQALSRKGMPDWLVDQMRPVADLKSALDGLAAKYEDTAARVARAEQAQTDAARGAASEQARIAQERSDAVVTSLRRETTYAATTPLQQSQRRVQEQAGVAPLAVEDEMRRALTQRADRMLTGTMPAFDRPSDLGLLAQGAAEEAARARKGVGVVRDTGESLVPTDPRGKSMFPSVEEQRTSTREQINALEVKRQTVAMTTQLTVSLREQNATVEAEIAAVGRSAGEAERLRIQQSTLNTFTRQGIEVGAELRAEIDARSAAYGRLTQKLAETRLEQQIAFDRAQLGRTATEQQIAATLRPVYGDDLTSAAAQREAAQLRVNDAIRETKDLSADMAKGFIADMRNGTSAAERFAHALDKIADKLMNRGVDIGIAALGRGLTSAFGGGGSPTMAQGGYGPDIPAGIGQNAMGTDNWRGGPTWINERGPEIVDLPQGSRVYPNGTTPPASAGVVVHMGDTQIDARGSSMTEGQFKAILAQNNSNLKAALPGMIADARSRGALR